MKTHWKKLRNPDYIGEWDFQPGEEKKVTITNVLNATITGNGGEKSQETIIKFKESKPLILNSTNGKKIASLLECPYVEDWEGAVLVLHIKKIKAFGEWVGATRVKDAYYPVKEELTTKHSKWGAAKKAIEEKKTTIE